MSTDEMSRQERRTLRRREELKTGKKPKAVDTRARDANRRLAAGNLAISMQTRQPGRKYGPNVMRVRTREERAAQSAPTPLTQEQATAGYIRQHHAQGRGIPATGVLTPKRSRRATKRSKLALGRPEGAAA